MDEKNTIDLDQSPALWALFYRVYMDQPDLLRIEQLNARRGVEFVWIDKEGAGHRVEIKGQVAPWKEGKFLSENIRLHTEGMDTVLSGEEYSYLMGGGSTLDISNLDPLWKTIEAACVMKEAKRLHAATAPAGASTTRRRQL